jgi:Domain of unknown function (DUF4333)/Protein of unknown function (DUF2510)
MTSSTQPGWYEDPEDASAQRYWDGQTWTPHRRRKPRSVQSPAPSAPPPPPVPAPAAPSGFPPPPGQQAPSVPSVPQPPGFAAQPSSNPGVNIGAAPIPPTPQQPPPPAPPPGAGQYAQPPPGQWAPPSPQAPAVAAKGGRSGAKVFLVAAAVVAVIVGVGVALWMSGVLNRETKKLAVAEVQTEVQKVLVDRVTGYTSSDIKDVTCNNGQDPTVKQGGSFTCSVTDRGKQHQLKVTFTDGSGTYEVGLPQLSGGK